MGLKHIIAACSILATIGLTGCAPAIEGPGSAAGSAGSAQATDRSSGTSAPRSINDIFENLGIDPTDPKAMITALDTLPINDRPSDLIVSVLPTAVHLQPGEPDEMKVPLVGDEFYLSIAPYLTQTHPCTFHSLTTCLGEMRNTPIELTVTDTASGTTVVSSSTSTADNGFVGVWLPRNGKFSVQITGEGGTAQQVVTTGDEDPTCLTTMQLR